MDITEQFKGKEIEKYSRDKQRTPSMLFVNIDEKCNENCVFCVIKGTNVDKFGSMKTEEIKKIVETSISNGGCDIVFTGGEPTLRKDLPEIIKYIQKFKKIKSINIITNGTGLADKKYFLNLIKSDKKNILTFSISLHSHIENISEQLTQKKGSYKKTIAGINNVLDYKKALSIYQVITSANYRDLPNFVKYINTNFPQIKNVTFAYPFPQGNALMNDWIYPRLSLLRSYFLKGLRFLEKENYEVAIASCGQFPLCAVPGFEEKVLKSLHQSEEDITGVVGEKSFHEFEMMSKEWIAEYKNMDEKCSQCLLNSYCQGFWKKYIELFDFDGLQPINQDNFKGNKIRQSLKTKNQVKIIINQINRNKLNMILLDDFNQDFLHQLTSYINSNKILAVIVYQNKRLFPI